jgi:uncharacterized surface protein with fasciclin (FAS1) repeats
LSITNKEDKMTKTLSKIGVIVTGAVLAFAALAMVSASQAGASSYRWKNTSNVPSITQTAVDNGSFTTLVSALQCTGLDRVTSSKWVRLTVFAPTDAAFAKLKLNADNICESFSKRDLRNILLYHVTLGVKDSSAVLSSSSLRMLNWQRAPIDALNLTIANAQLNLDLLNIKASNGIVHVVNDVMLPS